MQKREAAFGFILITLFLDMLGVGMIIPVWGKLITSITGGTESSSAFVLGLMTAAYSTMQFVFSPILGALSDQYGRRPVLLLSLLGMAVDYLLMAFAPTIFLLFVGRVIAGVTSANVTAANAYVADVTPPEERAKRFGMVGAVFGLGFILGPLLGGYIGNANPRLPFLVAALLAALNLIYGLFVLPESHKMENRRTFVLKDVNPLRSLGALGRYPSVQELAVALFCFHLAFQCMHNVWLWYTDLRFDWGPKEVGRSLMMVGVVVAIAQAGLTGWAVKRFGDRTVLIVSLAVGALAQFLYGMATQGWMMYAILLTGIISAMNGPVLQALVSKQVNADEQGSVQGALLSLQSITAVFGPLLSTWLFGYFTSPRSPIYLPGISFFVASALMVLGLALVIRTLQSSERATAVMPQAEPEPAG